MKDLSTRSRNYADFLLREAQDEQTRFWDTLGDLEGILGIEIESTQDLETMTVDGLLARAEG